nr:MAG TPA: hypothetical protein [Caudoviricetes sp.]DAH97434.1 MAG TPA: hypothetical protein [Bacteriophage sp.]DAN16694.1 MAG TPA: hypothetical protein [Bacteriophage sp.]DAO24155.1 MAG TPA: hypothetical protein [Caudoviricetes sp.]
MMYSTRSSTDLGFSSASTLQPLASANASKKAPICSASPGSTTSVSVC